MSTSPPLPPLNPQPLPAPLQSSPSSSSSNPLLQPSPSSSTPSPLFEDRATNPAAANPSSRPLTPTSRIPPASQSSSTTPRPHSQKRLRPSSTIASSSTSSLSDLALQHAPPPDQIDVMVRTHRRRFSENSSFFALNRTKRPHSDHLIAAVQTTIPQKKQISLAMFRLSKVLGTGGTATVVRAELKTPSVARDLIGVREVALKAVLKKGLSKRAKHYLTREIAIHQNVQHHHNIASLYHVFEDSKAVYLVLEFIRGSDLYSALRREGRGLHESYALAIIEQVLAALKHMHAMGCAHRDIKPENLMFAERPNFSNPRIPDVKLIDLGLACARNLNAPEKDRMSSEKCGTIRYAAPEIVTQTAYMPEFCDIWSVGIVLYSIIAHRNPYSGKTEKEVLHQIHNSTLVFEAVEWQTVSDDTKTFIRSCLNLKPLKRPTAANALREVRRIIDMLAKTGVSATGSDKNSAWESRSSRGLLQSDEAHRGLTEGQDFSEFSSNISGQGTSKSGRGHFRSNSDGDAEGADIASNFFEGVRAWFSGSSPEREEGSDGSN